MAPASKPGYRRLTARQARLALHADRVRALCLGLKALLRRVRAAQGSLLLAAFLLCSCDLESRSVVAEGVNHRIRPGESLFGIAEQAYGNGLEWPRIWEANQWIDPDSLRPGTIVFIPPRDPAWGDPPSRQTYALNPGSGSFEETGEPDGQYRSANPGGAALNGGMQVFRNLATNVSTKTLFGLPIPQVCAVLFILCMAHAMFQGILMWLAANITFVKDATFRKSMKAVFLTESFTFSTMIALGAVGVLMLYLGTGSGSTSGSLFPSLESYLQSPSGMGVAGLIILTLYVVLSLRFIPQVYGVPMSRAITLMALAILVPHLAGAYLVGQRTGLIH